MSPPLHASTEATNLQVATTPSLDPLQKRSRPRRLINTHTIQLEEFHSDNSTPRYAILSHRWEQDEISYQEMVHPSDIVHLNLKSGYTKIKNACSIARGNGYTYIWIDTCCINSGDHSQQSQDINSMFDYYKHSEVCYIYLNDYTLNLGYLEGPIDWSWMLSIDLQRSAWFSRGWTLQELLAPKSVTFIDAEWVLCQDDLTKFPLFCTTLQEVTGISEDVLHGKRKINTVSIAERMSWAINRQTTKEEDRAYCLLGLLDVRMEPRYGEGVESAFERLSNVLYQRYPDGLQGVPKTGRGIMEYLAVKNEETRHAQRYEYIGGYRPKPLGKKELEDFRKSFFREKIREKKRQLDIAFSNSSRRRMEDNGTVF